jgi:hypothetical protein
MLEGNIHMANHPGQKNTAQKTEQRKLPEKDFNTELPG